MPQVHKHVTTTLAVPTRSHIIVTLLSLTRPHKLDFERAFGVIAIVLGMQRVHPTDESQRHHPVNLDRDFAQRRLLPTPKKHTMTSILTPSLVAPKNKNKTTK